MIFSREMKRYFPYQAVAFVIMLALAFSIQDMFASLALTGMAAGLIISTLIMMIVDTFKSVDKSQR